jgi:site-specific DNA-methyltransferase (adenine-specific)
MTVTRTEVADIIEWLARYDGPPFMSLLCDPPYHLTTITKRFGKPGSAPAKEGTDGLFARASRGFMGQVWDGGDIAFRPETWAAFLPHLYPGAFGMAFASSRGWHRLACAIEDAGFIIHPSIFLWNYAQGFPKATRIDTKGGGEAWSGHRYGLQALKPAAEPIIVFQKPYEGKPVDDITRTGAGALNIDGSRIGFASKDDEETSHPGGETTSQPGSFGGFKGKDREPFIPTRSRGDAKGRWPSNFALAHHPDCGEQCVEGCPVAALDAQAPAGMHASGQASVSRYGGEEGPASISVGSGGGHGYGNETPSPSRFFHSGDWQAEALEQADPVLYAAKASVSEREAGLHLDGSEGRRCTHPTVKPIALARWLATLLLPPEQYAPRRILIPFSGVASEMIGAGLAGWEHVQGVELSKEYAELGAIRLEWWLGRGWQMPLFGG